MIQPLFIKKIILPIVIFFALVALLFYFTSGRTQKDQKTNPQYSAIPTPASDREPLATPAPASNGGVKIIEDQGGHVQVRYRERVFSPASVTVKNDNGCFVEIQNASDEIVIPRLGPYTSGKEIGFLYPAIAPRSSALIDPRYGTIHRFSFYNKNNPAAVFSVSIDPTCL